MLSSILRVFEQSVETEAARIPLASGCGTVSGIIHPHLQYSQLHGVRSSHKGRPWWPRRHQGMQELSQFILHGYLRLSLDRIWSGVINVLKTGSIVKEGYLRVNSLPVLTAEHITSTEQDLRSFDLPKTLSIHTSQQKMMRLLYLTCHPLLSHVMIFFLLFFWIFPLGYLSVGKKLF